jgi:hypothetical protein
VARQEDRSTGVRSFQASYEARAVGAKGNNRGGYDFMSLGCIVVVAGRAYFLLRGESAGGPGSTGDLLGGDINTVVNCWGMRDGLS